MVARFQAGEVPVFLLSLKAGGTGLNLTRADHVIHVDRWWNPAVEEQATDRAYRIGQTRPVQVHRLVTTGTIEERIAELLARKRALADSVLAAGRDRAHRAERRRAARPGHPAPPRRRSEDRDRDRRAAPAGRRPRAAGGPGPHLVGQGLGARGRGGGVRRGRPARGPGAWPGPGGSAASPSTPARSWPRSPTATRCGRSAAACRCSTTAAAQALVETVAAESGRIAALLAGDLPSPWSSTPRRPASSCCRTAASSRPPAPATPGPTRARTRSPCSTSWPGWSRPTRSCCCQLRGLARDQLLARLHDLAPTPARTRDDDDLEQALDAALRAARVLELLEAPGQPVDHLF